MKKTLMLALLTSALVFSGCAILSSGGFQTNAGKFLASTAVTVDATMKGWGQWNATHVVPAATQQQVRDAYGTYQTAMAAAQSAYNIAVTAKDPSIFTSPSNSLFSAKAVLVKNVTVGGTQ